MVNADPVAALAALMVSIFIFSTASFRSGQSPSATRKEGIMASREIKAIPEKAGVCGKLVMVSSEANATLTLHPALPTRAAAGSGLVKGEVTLTNQGDVRLRGTTRRNPDLILAQLGRVVATPLPADAVAVAVDLAAGEYQKFEVAGSLTRCSDGKALSPGTYEVFAAMTLNLADGAIAEVAGGPWVLVVL